ncbi:MAG TPA: hypothetical protein VFX96_04855 [Pyrinomonadaceae bacterium]|nr:hypothetical protein [Pyrinomonadaceae bacterium]
MHYLGAQLQAPRRAPALRMKAGATRAAVILTVPLVTKNRPSVT